MPISMSPLVRSITRLDVSRLTATSGKARWNDPSRSDRQLEAKVCIVEIDRRPEEPLLSI
jgi:hypothetical protein